MLGRDIKDFLLDDADVRSYATGGIWPSRVPRGTTGRTIVLQTITTQRQYSLTNEVGQSQFTYQIDCYGETPYHAWQLFEHVRNRLSGYRGTLGDNAIQGTAILSERELSEEPEDASDKWIHRYSADFQFFYPQTVPTHA